MFGRPPSPPRRHRACLACTKAKARCVMDHSTDSERLLCERCARLGMECQQNTTKVLRKARRLKERTQAAATAGSFTSSRPPTESQITTSAPSQQQAEKPNASHVPDDGPLQKHTQPNESLPPLGLSWSQVEQVLENFRDRWMPWFPFVLVKRNDAAQEVCSKRPFLARAIILVAAPFPFSRKEKLKRNVLANLGFRALVQEEVTLDILQGLLVCVAWSNACHLSPEQVNNLVYLSLSCVHNLGIAKASKPDEQSTTANTDDTSPSIDSLESERALLGCYCLFSSISVRYSRGNPLGAPYVDKCLSRLMSTDCSPSDLFLANLVQFVQKGQDLFQRVGEPHEQSIDRRYAFLLEGRGLAFRNELANLAQTTAHTHVGHYKSHLVLHRYYLMARLYEPMVAIILRGDRDFGGATIYRTTCLTNICNALQGFFEALFSEPETNVAHQSIISSEQTAFMVFLAARLLLVETPGWSTDSARAALDLPAIFDNTLARLSEAEAGRVRDIEAFCPGASETAQEDEQKSASIFVGLARKTRLVRDWYLALAFRKDGPKNNGYGAEHQLAALETAPLWYIGLLEDTSWDWLG